VIDALIQTSARRRPLGASEVAIEKAISLRRREHDHPDDQQILDETHRHRVVDGDAAAAARHGAGCSTWWF
jgi:hypothetical protein